MKSTAHRRLQFSLRTILACTFVLALVLGIVMTLAPHVRQAREEARNSECASELRLLCPMPTPPPESDPAPNRDSRTTFATIYRAYRLQGSDLGILDRQEREWAAKHCGAKTDLIAADVLFSNWREQLHAEHVYAVEGKGDNWADQSRFIAFRHLTRDGEVKDQETLELDPGGKMRCLLIMTVPRSWQSIRLDYYCSCRELTDAAASIEDREMENDQPPPMIYESEEIKKR